MNIVALIHSTINMKSNQTVTDVTQRINKRRLFSEKHSSSKRRQTRRRRLFDSQLQLHSQQQQSFDQQQRSSFDQQQQLSSLDQQQHYSSLDQQQQFLKVSKLSCVSDEQARDQQRISKFSSKSLALSIIDHVNKREQQMIHLSSLLFETVNHSQQTSIISWMLSSLLFQKLTMLYDNFLFHSSKTTQFKMIAVDDYDTRAAHAIVKYLHENISKHINLTMRVFESLARTIVHESSWFCYNKYIDQWNTLWKYLIKMSFSSTSMKINISLIFEAHAQSSTLFCVNIISFSSLMIILRAKTIILFSDQLRELQAWRRLASDWHEKIRSNITISVFEIDCRSNEIEMSRFSNHQMNTLAISKALETINVVDELSSKQLRRIDFEIMKWLIKN